MSSIPEFERYPFRIDPLPADEGGGFVIRFPDLPGCMSDGETFEEAIANGREAFQAWMEAQIEDGRSVPEPYGAGESAKFVQRVPQHIHAQLIQRAANEGVSMNTLVTTFIVEGLAAREAKQRFDAISAQLTGILSNLSNVEPPTSVGDQFQLFKKSVTRSQPGARAGGFSQVGSGGNVFWISDLNKAKDVVVR